MGQQPVAPPTTWVVSAAAGFGAVGVMTASSMGFLPLEIAAGITVAVVGVGLGGAVWTVRRASTEQARGRDSDSM